ncbi:hypothetical protein LOD99_4106 [Oopsacas minuta]|uniref:C2 domain-containing protein n=1 Tax=Oopsacas minuta TaxID=111878 RepID=A0AAV7JWM0_9METZ|nr:hypothetical protein LOD99_4106 [Oopsacas minuta]
MATYEMVEIGPVGATNRTSEDCEFFLQQQMRLEIQIEASNLHSTDVGDPDPYCIVKEVREGMLGSTLIGKTEKISNTKVPVFKSPIFVPYLYEEDQILQFSIYDFDLVGGNDLIGEVTIRAVELVKDKEMELTLRKKQRKTGILNLHVDIIPPLPPHKVSLQFIATMPKKFFKPNTYLIVSKLRCDKKTIQVHHSEMQKYKSRLMWNIENIERELLHTNDDSQLIFSVYSTKRFGEDRLLGSVEVTYDQIHCDEEFRSTLKEKVIVRSASTLAYDADNDSSVSTQIKLMSKGNIIISASKPKQVAPDYFNFLSENNIQVKIHVAIDFTASNGKHTELDSLHTVSGSGNKYIEVLQGALPGMLNGFTDKNIAAYGFGAKLKHETETCHCFQLDPNSPDVEGLDNLLEAYKSKIQKITLSGPTVFSKIVKTVALDVKVEKEKNPDSKRYNILLIITDGVICDREATIDSIVYASYLPISIVVVGIGNADFTDMRRLDGDLKPLKNGRNQQMIRDIVQFVSLESIEKNRELVKEYEKEEHFLTKAINREIPEQIIEYYDELEKKIGVILKEPYKSIQWWTL